MEELSDSEQQRLLACKKASDDALRVWGCSMSVRLQRADLTIQELETLRGLLKRGRMVIELVLDGKNPGPDAVVVGGPILN